MDTIMMITFLLGNTVDTEDYEPSFRHFLYTKPTRRFDKHLNLATLNKLTPFMESKLNSWARANDMHALMKYGHDTMAWLGLYLHGVRNNFCDKTTKFPFSYQ